jgi:hypothetical protein
MALMLQTHDLPSKSTIFHSQSVTVFVSRASLGEHRQIAIAVTIASMKALEVILKLLRVGLKRTECTTATVPKI